VLKRFKQVLNGKIRSGNVIGHAAPKRIVAN